MLLNFIKNGILDFLFAIMAYAQDALQKKSALLVSLIIKLHPLLDSLVAIKLSLLNNLIAPFVEQFKGKPWQY